ncbi:MAG: hypothetical protein A2Y88_14945 [Chloroflexi bacterium RBG_13_48_10]|nr:MAG: hypothetical protein A2Y88_14945 [Chloroflexi bacterium RBG_13_48_10]
MKVERQIEQIIDAQLPAIFDGAETVESILVRYPQIAGELRPRLEAAFWLRQAAQGADPRPGFVISSRKYLESHIESMQPRGLWQRLFRRYTPQRWVFNIASPVLVALLLVALLNSLVLSARLSIPGDTLYSSKLLIEDIQLALTFDQVDKTELYIQISRERTTEFVELVLEGDYEYLPTAANRLESEIIASLHSLNDFPINGLGEEQAMAANLRDTLSNEIFMLNVLKGTTPPSAYPGIELAIQVAQSGLMALR